MQYLNHATLCCFCSSVEMTLIWLSCLIFSVLVFQFACSSFFFLSFALSLVYLIVPVFEFTLTVTVVLSVSLGLLKWFIWGFWRSYLSQLDSLGGMQQEICDWEGIPVYQTGKYIVRLTSLSPFLRCRHYWHN